MTCPSCCKSHFNELTDRYQETEIKNGRIAMLGVLGLLVPEFYTFPQLTAGAYPAANFNAVRPFSL